MGFIGHKGAAAGRSGAGGWKASDGASVAQCSRPLYAGNPGGRIKRRRRAPMLAAARELEEETGYHSENLTHLLSLRTTVAFCNEKIEIYVAQDFKADPSAFGRG